MALWPRLHLTEVNVKVFLVGGHYRLRYDKGLRYPRGPRGRQRLQPLPNHRHAAQAGSGPTGLDRPRSPASCHFRTYRTSRKPRLIPIFPGGGAVFSVGSIAWSASLSHNKYANNVSRIAKNVVRRFLKDEPFSMPD